VSSNHDDVFTLVALIMELAVYEKLEAHAKATPDDLRRHLFGRQPAAEALIAEAGGRAVGFALFFQTFSTFRGRPSLYLEDVFVQPAHRARGIGKALLQRVARVAVERRCGRVDWAVLDWNKPAIAFYRSLGARALDEWTIYRLEGADLDELGRSTPELEP
jgi:GNAT superfamily N-acetyltransferase